MKRTALAALGALLLASGCQSNQDPSQAGATLTATSSPTPQLTASSPVPSASAAPASPSPVPTPTPSAAAKLYKMNRNYDFVPADPNGGAPAKVVLLTFDDGPKDQAILVSMLDTLDKHRAKAIFFVNGYRLKQNPDLLKLIHDRGQTIGNHSWDHIDLKKEPDAKVDQQIGDVQSKVKELTGTVPRFFRPPFGSGSDYVKEKAKNEKLLYMTWSNGSLDWETKTNDKPQEVIDNVLKQLHPGSNILMHELAWTAEALDRLLTELEGKGYGFLDPAAIEPVQ